MTAKIIATLVFGERGTLHVNHARFDKDFFLLTMIPKLEVIGCLAMDPVDEGWGSTVT